MSKQTITVPLNPGAHVVIFDEVDTEPGGFVGSMVFEDKVEQYVPETAKLEFRDSDIGYAEFITLLEENESVQIIKE